MSALGHMYAATARRETILKFEGRPRKFGLNFQGLFGLAPNAFVHEVGPVLHFNFLFHRPFFAFAHLCRLVGWHHLFHCSGLHPIRRTR